MLGYYKTNTKSDRDTDSGAAGPMFLLCLTRNQSKINQDSASGVAG